MASDEHNPATTADPLDFRESPQALDAKDSLRHLRDEFIIPSKGDLKSKRLAIPEAVQTGQEPLDPCVYMCGNSLGLQPRLTAERVSMHLNSWGTKGVYGHFTPLEGSALPPFLHVDDVAAEKMSTVVGALPSEVAVMQTLTVNLHLLMLSFYRPDTTKYKIIIEGKAFPSDHYAVESQLRHHGFDPADAMVLIEPPSTEEVCLSTEQILSVIDEKASTTALILLPGVQYYTGQYLDIPTITAHAHSKDIIIGWDLAHAVGNVELELHDWNIDFAAWCNYKYLNSGPGAIAGMFVHEKHGRVDAKKELQGEEGYRPRLSGWWGNDKNTRFRMDNEFIPIPGAAGFQLSNPSALDMSAVLASLEIFSKTTMAVLRQKSIRLTGYLEHLLLEQTPQGERANAEKLFAIITPAATAARGAQLSLRLAPGLLEPLLHELERRGVVVDERRPDVVRVAPAPLYNSYADVAAFADAFHAALAKAVEDRSRRDAKAGV